MTRLPADCGRTAGQVCGAAVTDVLSGEQFQISAKATVIAGGPYTDSIRELEAAAESPGGKLQARATTLLCYVHICLLTCAILSVTGRDLAAAPLCCLEAT